MQHIQIAPKSNPAPSDKPIAVCCLGAIARGVGIALCILFFTQGILQVNLELGVVKAFHCARGARGTSWTIGWPV